VLLNAEKDITKKEMPVDPVKNTVLNVNHPTTVMSVLSQDTYITMTVLPLAQNH